MPAALKPPIFLLGNVRSGTTMIQSLFGLHPEVETWFEPRTVWTYADPARRHDRFDAQDATPRVSAYIRGRFEKYQTVHVGRRIMEKTPSNMLRIPYVHAIFPEARFLYLIREPLANLSSSELMWRLPIHRNKAWRRIKETPKTQLHHYVGRFVIDQTRVRVLRRRHVSIWGVRYPGIYEDLKTMLAEEIIAHQWVKVSAQARTDLADLPARLVLSMRYEDFVADPDNSFATILEHFDLEITPAIAETLRRQIDAGRQQKWRRLDDSVIRKCLAILENEMAQHGYATPKEYRHLRPGA